MTINKAYSCLERYGIVERRPGRPLVVKALEENPMNNSELRQFRDSLQPRTTMVTQFGIPKEEASGVFDELLSDTHCICLEGGGG
jgi:DNA-binding transcriptional regulator YhcF (GntR family)